MSWVLNMPKFWKWQSSIYGRVLKMQTLHIVLSMSEYSTIFAKHSILNPLEGSEYASVLNTSRFWLSQDCHYARVLNFQGYAGFTNFRKYGWVLTSRGDAITKKLLNFMAPQDVKWPWEITLFSQLALIPELYLHYVNRNTLIWEMTIIFPNALLLYLHIKNCPSVILYHLWISSLEVLYTHHLIVN